MMASRLISRGSSTLVPCHPSSSPLTAVTIQRCDSSHQHIRSAPSSHSRALHSGSGGHRIVTIKGLSHDSSSSSFTWPDARLGPLEPKTRRFPLPGFVGPTKSRFTKPKVLSLPPRNYDSDILTAELSHERQSTILEQFVAVSRQQEANEKEWSQHAGSDDSDPTSFDRFECAAHECPMFLVKDVYELFPNLNLISSRQITVITLCQKVSGVFSPVAEAPESCQQYTEYRDTDAPVNTVGDSLSPEMTGEVKAEGTEKDVGRTKKKELIESFIDSATDICEVLHDAGYWADFIDPTSGNPYIDNQMLESSRYETDERYRRLGFEISVSKSGCKVLTHHVWGSKPYVGCLFTNIPIGHPLVRDLASPKRKKTEEMAAWKKDGNNS